MTTVMTTSGLGKPPLICKGSALYQIHLVKVDAVRRFVPKELRLVEAFGYTLGGFYLGTYEESTLGPFDEALLAVIAGIVWNDRSSWPASWAAKVLVSNDQVQHHAREEFGVSSQVANFLKKSGGYLNINGLGDSKWPKNYKDVQIREIKEEEATHCSNFNFSIKTAATPNLDLNNRFIRSPQIKLSLPSLSGLTEYKPDLLEYTCQIEARVRIVAAAMVSEQLTLCSEEDYDSTETNHRTDSAKLSDFIVRRILMHSKPLMAFQFNSMKMIVHSPTVV